MNTMQVKHIIVCALVLSVFASVNCVANTVIDVSSNAFPTATALSDLGLSPRYFFSGDYFMFSERPDEPVSKLTTKIYKYDKQSSDFAYLAQYNVSFSRDYSPATNGKWFGTYDSDAGKLALFQLGNPNPSDFTPTFITPLGAFLLFRIMPDDSVVLVLINGLFTYTYNGTAFVLKDQSDFTVTYASPSILYDLTDTHFINWNTSGAFKIYARNQQLGWDLIEDHETDSSYSYRLTGGPPTRTTVIDGQTVMLQSFYGTDPRNPSAGANGFLFITTKVDGVWKDQFIYSVDMPSAYPSSSLGYNSYVLDSNNVLISVPNDRYDFVNSKRATDAVEGVSVGDYGTAFLIQRSSDNSWSSVVQFSRTGKDGYFALGLGANDENGFILACDFAASLDFNCYPYSFKKCIIAPINVTCHDIVLPDCTDVNFENVNLYTQNDAECGVATAEMLSVRVKDNKIVTTFSFTRPLAPAPVTCDASVTCPLTAAPAAPVTVSAPVSAPNKVSGVAQLSAVTVAIVWTTFSLLL